MQFTIFRLKGYCISTFNKKFLQCSQNTRLETKNGLNLICLWKCCKKLTFIFQGTDLFKWKKGIETLLSYIFANSYGIFKPVDIMSAETFLAKQKVGYSLVKEMKINIYAASSGGEIHIQQKN